MSKNYDLEQRALDTLPSRYNADEFVRAHAKAFASAGQLIEDAAHDLIVNSRISNATGEYLDNWGGVVDENRGDLGDDLYRRLILAKIASNRSYGRPEGVFNTIDALWPDRSNLRVVRYQPATARVVVFADQVTDASWNRRAYDLLENAYPTGVQLSFAYGLSEDATLSTLRFDTANGRQFDEGLFARTETYSRD